jgi:AcrR family transcriptional regulator
MAREMLLDRVLRYAATQGLADRSLREIAVGVGTSHRMLLYHFGSRAGLLAAVVATVEEQQRDLLATLTATSGEAGADSEVMVRLWDRVSDPDLRPFVRVFFAVVGLAVQGVAGTESLLGTLTGPWLAEGAETARRIGVPADPAALRLGVAVTRGLLLELLAGADPDQVDAAYRLFVDMWRHWMDRGRT